MRTGLNWIIGLKLAAEMAAVQLLLAGGSYLTGCAIFRHYQCGIEHGARWVLAHPVFPVLAAQFISLSFLLGLLMRGDGEQRRKAIQSAGQEAASPTLGRRVSASRLVVMLLEAALIGWILWDLKVSFKDWQKQEALLESLQSDRP